MENIDIKEVERINGKVVKVCLQVLGRVTINYIRLKDERILESSRGPLYPPGGRMGDPEKLWMPDSVYKKMIRRVQAIFNEKK